MMHKIWTLAWKDVYITFRDRNLLLIMIATPLVISTLLGVVFGGFAEGGNLAFSDIPVAIVNMDEGAEQQGDTVNYGANLASFLIPGEGGGDFVGNGAECTLVEPEATEQDENQPNISIDELINATALDDAEAAREAVRSGDYTAAIIIPPDFSESMVIEPASFGSDVSAVTGDSPIEVYANSGQPISATIVRSIVEGYSSNLVTGNVAIASSINALISTNPASAIRLGSTEAQGVYPCAFSGLLSTVRIRQLPVTTEGGPTLSGVAQILVIFGSAQAAFFALFTGQFGIISIVEERRAGTLQRILVSPTPRSAILTGKLLGTFVQIVFQLTILFLALTLVASIIDQEPQFIWGSNIIGLVAIILALAAAVCGLAVLMAGIARTPEQVGALGSIVNIIIAVAGGAFGFAVPSPVREISMIYWGSDALNKLARGETDFMLNVVVLLVMGAVLFGIGIILFNRQQDI